MILRSYVIKTIRIRRVMSTLYYEYSLLISVECRPIILRGKQLCAALLTFLGFSRLTPKSALLYKPASERHCNTQLNNMYIIYITCLY